MSGTTISDLVFLKIKWLLVVFRCVTKNGLKVAEVVSKDQTYVSQVAKVEEWLDNILIYLMD